MEGYLSNYSFIREFLQANNDISILLWLMINCTEWNHPARRSTFWMIYHHCHKLSCRLLLIHLLLMLVYLWVLFSIINLAICFKTFETRFLAGLGEDYLSRTLEQIRGTSQFRDLCYIVWEIVTPFLLIQEKRISSLASASIFKLCGNTAFCLKLT